MGQIQQKNILITLEYPPKKGGVSRYYQNLVDFFGPEKIQVLSTKLTWILWPKWLPAVYRVWREVKKNNQYHLILGQVLPLGYVALILKFFCRLNFSVFTHGMDILLPQSNWWKNRWMKKILQEADWVVANSLFTKRELEKLGVSGDKIEIVYPCVGRMFAPLKRRKEGGVLLSVGRLVKRKNFDAVIGILPEILKQFPQTIYVLIGDGPEEENLRNLAANLQLEKNVLFFKNINDQTLDDWYARADLFIMPCRRKGPDVEGLGTVFLEAAAHGLPVIVGNSGGAAEAVIDGRTGLLVQPDSPEELAKAITLILSDKVRADKMGEEGRKMVEDRFFCHLQFIKIAKIIG